MKLSLALTALTASSAAGQHSSYQAHYLVGLLNHPNNVTPEALQGHTSGTYLDPENSNGVQVPFTDVPEIGFSDIELYYDEDGNSVLGEYYVLSDNGYGGPDTSGDYALNIQHVKIQKPFSYRHGESTFERYTEVENLGAALIHDPNGYIKWEGGQDIQVAYHIPDETWTDYRDMRVLTGRDLDVESLAVLNQTCALVGEEFMPSVFMVSPLTGEVLSPFVRTPDIDENGDFNEVFLSTRADKVHCSIEDLEDEEDQCKIVDSSVVEDSEYRKHDKSGGFEGMSLLDDGTIVAFLEKRTGDTTLQEEPGSRVYRVFPGDCSSGSEPTFDSFLGYYPKEFNAESIADVSAIPGSSRYVAVIERNEFPKGHMFPASLMPTNKLCIVDLLDTDDDMVMRNKKCILNYQDVSDPFDTDGNGIFKYALIQVTSEALIVVDDYCIIAGTDTNYPWTNQLNLEPEMVPDLQAVTDARFMVVCFVEPIFNPEMLGQFMTRDSPSGVAVGRQDTSSLRQGASEGSGGRRKLRLAFPLFLLYALTASFA